jgi:hypothetical protein
MYMYWIKHLRIVEFYMKYWKPLSSLNLSFRNFYFMFNVFKFLQKLGEQLEALYAFMDFKDWVRIYIKKKK